MDSPWRYVSLPEGVLSFSLFGMFSQDASHVVFFSQSEILRGKKVLQKPKTKISRVLDDANSEAF